MAGLNTEPLEIPVLRNPWMTTFGAQKGPDRYRQARTEDSSHLEGRAQRPANWHSPPPGVSPDRSATAIIRDPDLAVVGGEVADLGCKEGKKPLGSALWVGQ
jgi:hypothetical protein